MKMAQSRIRTAKAAKRMRSANAPVMRAGVMTANMHWKATKASSGIVPFSRTLADLVEAADEAADVRAERHGITEDDPLNGDHRDDEETLHDGRQDVLAADHAAVEERETRCHYKDQGCTDEHPGRIASVNHKNPFLSISSKRLQRLENIIAFPVPFTRR